MAVSRETSKIDIIDLFVKATVPILCAAVGFVANSILDHETRIAVIESNRYTDKDAANEMAKLKKSILDAINKDTERIVSAMHVRERENSDDIDDMRKRLDAITTSIVAIETKIKAMNGGK